MNGLTIAKKLPMSGNFNELEEVIQDIVSGEKTLFQISHLDLIRICEIFVFNEKLGKNFNHETGTFDVPVEDGKTLEEINQMIINETYHEIKN